MAKLLRWLVPAVLVLVWLGVSGMGGPYFGKLEEVQSQAATDFLPRTAESTRVSEIQTALADMGETQRSVAVGLSASHSVAEEISGIQGEVALVVGSIRDIAEATREQSVATNEMARAAEEVNRMALENDQAVQGATRTVVELSSLSNGLRGLVGGFRL